MTRILLADDHPIVRKGLRKVLEERREWSVVAEAGDGREAVRLAEQHKPDIAIIDIGMPLLNGIEATRQIVRRVPKCRVLILSMHSDEAYITRAIQAGAKGFLLKDAAGQDLVRAVAAVADLMSDRPSRFEALTAAAFRWFADVPVHAGVIEVGLLGRWDATNVIDAQVAVLTNVGADHLDYAEIIMAVA